MKRRTRQRECILEILKGVRTHPTADWIYEEARKSFPNISMGTVYRNLKVLQQEGVITELDLSGTMSRFEFKQDRHYHFRCENCGRVIDFNEPVDKGLDRRVERRTGLKINCHLLEFRGLCKKCQSVN
ncbi:MAG: transcriptional repressor [Dehalococcoidia bacterium]|nr:transcriptional repressor [Dehalococcoidia bacterium]